MALVDLNRCQLRMGQPHAWSETHRLSVGHLRLGEASELMESRALIEKGARIARALARTGGRPRDSVLGPSGGMECDGKMPTPFRQVGPDAYGLLERRYRVSRPADRRQHGCKRE